jgi:ZIP family zinc transporter
MLEAATWGAVAASSLLVGMLVAFVWTPARTKLGFVLAFGAGALFAAVAFDLVDSALEHGTERLLTIGMLVGAITYVVGSRVLRSTTGDEEDDDSRSIVLGATLDGIPESLAIGATVATAGGAGAMSLTLPVAVALSNFPEALGATVGMRASKQSTRSIVLTWGGLVAGSAVAAALGYAVLAEADTTWTALLDSFTAGAVLAMVADTMTPDAYRDAGRIAGIATVLGFAVSLLLS